MYKNRAGDRNNLCGAQLRRLRLALPEPTSQRMLAEDLILLGLELNKNAIQRIESGQRFVTDIELQAFCCYFAVDPAALLEL
jgi:hypothetical protein